MVAGGPVVALALVIYCHTQVWQIKSTHKNTLWKKNKIIWGVVAFVESYPRLKNVGIASSIYTSQTWSWPNHTTHVIIYPICAAIALSASVIRHFAPGEAGSFQHWWYTYKLIWYCEQDSIKHSKSLRQIIKPINFLWQAPYNKAL